MVWYRGVAGGIGRIGDVTGFEHSGRVWMRNALAEGEGEAILDGLGHLAGAVQRVTLSGGLGETLEASETVRALRATWPGMRPVRAVYFDKTEAVNWALPWHQDRVIAVRERAEVPGYRNWTRKAGVWHCEPPERVLSAMLFTRFHLDDAAGDEGAMEIALGSHRRGVVAAEEAEAIAASCPVEVTEARAGDVLILNMLILHRSRAAQKPRQRRVLRVDFAPFDLPRPLEWAG